MNSVSRQAHILFFSTLMDIRKQRRLQRVEMMHVRSTGNRLGPAIYIPACLASELRVDHNACIIHRLSIRGEVMSYNTGQVSGFRPF